MGTGYNSVTRITDIAALRLEDSDWRFAGGAKIPARKWSASGAMPLPAMPMVRVTPGIPLNDRGCVEDEQTRRSGGMLAR